MDELTILYILSNIKAYFAPVFSAMAGHALFAISHEYFPFVFLFVFRYLRLIVHLFSFWVLYRPAPIPDSPNYTRDDCTVIIPTVEPQNHDFKECLESVIRNQPHSVLIVTVGASLEAQTTKIVAPYMSANPNINFMVTSTQEANKRRQVGHAIPHVTTSLTILVDDHVFWPSTNFLPTICAPFEDEKVGAVGTNKRVRRTDLGFNIRSFWNMIGALYLERHNFEIRATNAIDGGVFVISGRTAAHRTTILQDPEFLHGFQNEYFFFGKYGPLNADDDNFITRWEVSKGYKIKIQYCKDALIETPLGTYPKFLSQCLRWVRTTWRSNSASLFTDRTVWRTQPWCVYAVYITSFFNFALFTDAALMWLAWTTFGGWRSLACMYAWIFATKMVKLTPYFLRHPEDLVMLPGYFLFAYGHSLIKLYAGLTFYEVAWSGRNLAAVNQDGDDNDDAPGAGPNAGNGDHHSSSFSSSSSSGDHSPFPRYMVSAPPLKRKPWTTTTALPDQSCTFRTTTITRPAVPTPWGRVTPSNLHAKPANVLESHMPYRAYGSDLSRSPSPNTRQGYPTPQSRAPRTPPPTFRAVRFAAPTTPDYTSSRVRSYINSLPSPPASASASASANMLRTRSGAVYPSALRFTPPTPPSSYESQASSSPGFGPQTPDYSPIAPAPSPFRELRVHDDEVGMGFMVRGLSKEKRDGCAGQAQKSWVRVRECGRLHGRGEAELEVGDGVCDVDDGLSGTRM